MPVDLFRALPTPHPVGGASPDEFDAWSKVLRATSAKWKTPVAFLIGKQLVKAGIMRKEAWGEKADELHLETGRLMRLLRVCGVKISDVDVTGQWADKEADWWIDSGSEYVERLLAVLQDQVGAGEGGAMTQAMLAKRKLNQGEVTKTIGYEDFKTFEQHVGSGNLTQAKALLAPDAKGDKGEFSKYMERAFIHCLDDNVDPAKTKGDDGVNLARLDKVLREYQAMIGTSFCDHHASEFASSTSGVAVNFDMDLHKLLAMFTRESGGADFETSFVSAIALVAGARQRQVKTLSANVLM